MPALFSPKPLNSWVAIGVVVLAILICWGSFLSFVEPGFEGHSTPTIDADSTTYYEIAGILPANPEFEGAQLVTFGGNLLGPVLVAKILRKPVFVTLFNFFLLSLMVHIASHIPEVRRRYFLLLFFLNAESVVSLVTLNKEIFSAVGVVAFIAFIAVKTHRKRFFLVALIFSIMARWEQLAIILLYALLECRYSPFRHRHKLALLFVLAILTVTYTAILRYSGLDLSGFLAVAESSGVVARLDNIQANFGLPLVILPKALMNLFNRLLSPAYFVSNDFLTADFNALQTNIIIHLHSIAMLALAGVALIKHRLGVSRPIPYLIYLYVMITSVSPFIQPRYEFPVYALLCLQLSIDPAFFAKSPLPAPRAKHCLFPVACK